MSANMLNAPFPGESHANAKGILVLPLNLIALIVSHVSTSLWSIWRSRFLTKC